MKILEKKVGTLFEILLIQKHPRYPREQHETDGDKLVWRDQVLVRAALLNGIDWLVV